MDNSTKNRLEGTFHDVKDSVKEKAGEILGNPRLEIEGQEEKVAGKVQKKGGEIEEKIEKKLER